jgi:hypothetical protein
LKRSYGHAFEWKKTGDRLETQELNMNGELNGRLTSEYITVTNLKYDFNFKIYNPIERRLSLAASVSRFLALRALFGLFFLLLFFFLVL